MTSIVFDYKSIREKVQGDGLLEKPAKPEKCPICNGKGLIYKRHNSGFTIVLCPDCQR